MNGTALELVVADAGPLIGLAIVGGLRWIRRLFHKVLIPDAVAAELCLDTALSGAAALAAARDRGWLQVVAVPHVPAHLLATVDRGEAEAITLAKRHAVPLLIDESRGRTAARNEGVHVFGSGAVLIMAKQRRIIHLVRPHLDALTRTQYRLSKALRSEILRQAGESAA